MSNNPMGRPSTIPATLDQIQKYGQVAAVIRGAMARLGLSQMELSRRMGYTTSSLVSHWCGAKGAPSPTLRAKLAEILEVDPVLLDKTHYRPLAPVTSVGRARVSPSPPPPARTPQELLSFSVDQQGQARISLDVTLPLATAAPLLRLLLDAGLVMGAKPDE